VGAAKKAGLLINGEVSKVHKKTFPSNIFMIFDTFYFYNTLYCGACEEGEGVTP